MILPIKPPIITRHDLLHYTGIPHLPDEKPDRLTPEEREKGGRPARKVISGVRYGAAGNRKGGTPCWRVRIAKSGKDSRGQHDEFAYDCPTKEEAAYLASMAHEKLKPWFARMCRDGDGENEPARQGDAKYFWNNIWGLWKFCRLSTQNGEFLVGAIPGAQNSKRPVFVTDWNVEIYARVVQAPMFNRRTVNHRKNYEPVQPMVVPNEKNGVKVVWTGLSELVFGQKLEIPEGRLIGIDFRKAALLGENPLPIWPGPETHPNGYVPAIHPEKFNAVIPAIPDWARFHPYGVLTMNYK